MQKRLSLVGVAPKSKMSPCHRMKLPTCADPGMPPTLHVPVLANASVHFLQAFGLAYELWLVLNMGVHVFVGRLWLN